MLESKVFTFCSSSFTISTGKYFSVSIYIIQLEFLGERLILVSFVKSKQAGERLLEMVKEVLGNDDTKTWLDYREDEPEWIQFKFQKEEFDLEKLHKMATENDNVLTKEILIECAIT